MIVVVCHLIYTNRWLVLEPEPEPEPAPAPALELEPEPGLGLELEPELALELVLEHALELLEPKPAPARGLLQPREAGGDARAMHGDGVDDGPGDPLLLQHSPGRRRLRHHC